MRVRRVQNPSDILRLAPVFQSWRSTCNNIDGLSLDYHTHIKDLMAMVVEEDSDLYVLEDDTGVYGYMGLKTFNSPLGNQRIASEHYWYVVPEKRGVSALRFIPLARKWAREKGCSHLIMTASTLAGDLHDKVCKMYERFDMEKFETSYIKRV